MFADRDTGKHFLMHILKPFIHKQLKLRVRSSIVKGHKFSERPYTLYSMRSTFIENHILRGTDAYLLARICGNSVATIMQTYERIDIRRRTKELTDIEFGSKRGNPETISLFDE